MRRVRIGIKAKQIAAVTAIVGLAVVALSAVHVTRLARVVLHESNARGQLANAIFHRAREVVVINNSDPRCVAQRSGLRAILESASTVRMSPTPPSSTPTASSGRQRPHGKEAAA
jgi:hypothetical protein